MEGAQQPSLGGKQPVPTPLVQSYTPLSEADLSYDYEVALSFRRRVRSVTTLNDLIKAVPFLYQAPLDSEIRGLHAISVKRGNAESFLAVLKYHLETNTFPPCIDCIKVPSLQFSSEFTAAGFPGLPWGSNGEYARRVKSNILQYAIGAKTDEIAFLQSQYLAQEVWLPKLQGLIESTTEKVKEFSIVRIDPGVVGTDRRFGPLITHPYAGLSQMYESLCAAAGDIGHMAIDIARWKTREQHAGKLRAPKLKKVAASDTWIGHVDDNLDFKSISARLDKLEVSLSRPKGRRRPNAAAGRVQKASSSKKVPTASGGRIKVKRLEKSRSTSKAKNPKRRG